MRKLRPLAKVWVQNIGSGCSRPASLAFSFDVASRWMRRRPPPEASRPRFKVDLPGKPLQMGVPRVHNMKDRAGLLGYRV